MFIMGAMRSCWSLFWVREIILIFCVSRQRYNVSESEHEPCTHPSTNVRALVGGISKSSHIEAAMVAASACGCDDGCDCAGGCAGGSTALVAATALATLESALEAALVAALEAAPVAAGT